MGILVFVGTTKGALLFRSDDGRQNWQIEGPLFKGWKVTAVAREPGGRYVVGTASDVYGCALHMSDDLKTWEQVQHGPEYSKDGDAKLKEVWKIVASGESVYCGVADAGLFCSRDRGAHWEPMNGLNVHKTRSHWCPGAGGLCAHSILIDPENDRRLWCGISAVGVFRSEDGGETWVPKNEGVPVILEDKDFSEIGYCVHALAQDPDNGDIIYRQDHRGMFRTANGGDRWERNENGLSSGFGFPLVIDRSTKALYAVPMEADEYRFPKDGRLLAFRSTDGGDSWDALSNGLPQQHAYAGVLRGAMAVDHRSPCGVYMGTTSGDVYFSIDGGDHWNVQPCRLARVLCVSVFED